MIGEYGGNAAILMYLVQESIFHIVIVFETYRANIKKKQMFTLVFIIFFNFLICIQWSAVLLCLRYFINLLEILFLY